jgi:CRP-like cAMP-binding protein
VTPSRPDNHLLAALSPADMAGLRPFLREVSLKRGQVLREPGRAIEHVYFPHGGVIALMVLMVDGRAVETAMISREGVVGAMAGLGLDLPLTRAVVQVASNATRVAVTDFRRAVRASDRLRDMLVRYQEVLLGQVQISAACNALHPIEARLARWILQTRDRTATETIPLTQELLSRMLGVRRVTVSAIAVRFQAAGIISYTRGALTIIDRAKLEAAACECYQLTNQRIGLMLPRSVVGQSSGGGRGRGRGRRSR